jgi:hypothetical protein
VYFSSIIDKVVGVFVRFSLRRFIQHFQSTPTCTGWLRTPFQYTISWVSKRLLASPDRDLLVAFCQ